MWKDFQKKGSHGSVSSTANFPRAHRWSFLCFHKLEWRWVILLFRGCGLHGSLLCAVCCSFAFGCAILTTITEGTVSYILERICMACLFFRWRCCGSKHPQKVNQPRPSWLPAKYVASIQEVGVIRASFCVQVLGCLDLKKRTRIGLLCYRAGRDTRICVTNVGVGFVSLLFGKDKARSDKEQR